MLIEQMVLIQTVSSYWKEWTGTVGKPRTVEGTGV